jgi:hypothetical protein
MLTEWTVSGRPTAKAAATVKTPGFIAITCNNTDNNVKDTLLDLSVYAANVKQ